MRSKLAKAFIYIAVLLVVFTFLQQITYLDTDTVLPQDGTADLAEHNFSASLARIAAEHWEYYPGKLYTPSDFASGRPEPPHIDVNDSLADYGTYRLRLKLPLDRIYAMTGRSFSFSQRVFINGDFTHEVGVIGTSRETTLPASRTYDYYFIPHDGAAEIIFQTANFHHREGARNRFFLLGEPDMVGRYRALEFIRSNIVVGTLLTVFLSFGGLFIFFRHRPQFLFLGLTALASAARMTLIGEKHAMVLFPSLDWFTAMRLEYLSLILFVVCFLLYFMYSYPKMYRWFFVAAVLGASCLYALVVVFGDTLFFTRILKWYTAVWVLAAAVTAAKLFFLLRDGGIKTALIFTGFVVFLVSAVYDEATYVFLYNARLHNTMITGSLVCIFMNMLSLSLNFSETEQELGESRIAIMLSQIQPHFLYNALTVIRQLCDINPKMAKDTVSDFAEYLRGNLDSLTRRDPIPFTRELEHVKTYLALEQKRFGSRLRIHWDIAVTDFQIPALTLQMLVENAVRHGVTKREEGGTIRIRTEGGAGFRRIIVEDDGVGFTVDGLVPDGKNHVGLVNVRGRLASQSGGTLTIESTPGVGTKASITIPGNRIDRPAAGV